MQPRWRVRHGSNPIAGRRFAAALLIVVGLALFMAFLLGPVRHVIEARLWRAQECKILSSKVQRYRTTKGRDAYSPEIFYSYVVDDREHRCDPTTFLSIPENGLQRSVSPAATGGARP